MNISKIVVLSSSVRTGRKTHVIAEYVVQLLNSFETVQAQLLDLKSINLPMFETVLEPSEYPPNLQVFSDTLTEAQGIVVVCPEYKNSLPGVLKNAFDYLKPQVFKHIPMANITIGSNPFGGLNSLAHLRLIELAMGGLPIPEKHLVNVNQVFLEDQTLNEAVLKEPTEKFLKAFMWYVNRLSA